MGIDAEAGRQRCREGQAVAGRRSREVAGDVQRKSLAFVGGLVRDRGCGRAAVSNPQDEGLAGRVAVDIGGRHRDRVVAEITAGRHPGDNAGMGIDAEAGGQRS